MELILVDNGSKDETVELAEQLWKNSGSSVFFKILKEPDPGLSAARKKGIREAGGEFILFCDDDNHLRYDYVDQAVQIMEEDHLIGALCGYNEPLFNGEIPEPVKNNLTAYACGHEGMDSCYLDKSIAPWGAGLVLRADFMKRLFELDFRSLLSDRTGKELGSGGDTEYCYLLRLAGYKWKYDIRLSLLHNIPEDRLNLNYLTRIYKGFGEANVVIDLYYRRGDFKQLEHKLIWWKVYLSQYIHFLKHPIRSVGDQRKLDQAFRNGYMKKLWKERRYFIEKQTEVRDIISKLPHVH
jgi:glycosyltransferase involved in cell wall biosynthesis